MKGDLDGGIGAAYRRVRGERFDARMSRPGTVAGSVCDSCPNYGARCELEWVAAAKVIEREFCPEMLDVFAKDMHGLGHGRLRSCV